MTVVTAYYEIKSKRPTEKYREWISYFMNVDLKCVIFVDPSSDLPDIYPRTERRKYFYLPISDFETSIKWNWEEDVKMDDEIRIGHNINLYKIWNEKIFFIKRVIDFDPSEEFFLWLDIGAVRTPMVSDFLKNSGFPKYHKLQKNKVTVILIESFTKEETERLEEIDSRFKKVDRIGGLFAGERNALQRFSRLHSQTLDEFENAGVFKGKDQSVYNYQVLRYPELFHVLNSKEIMGKHSRAGLWSDHGGRWFAIEAYLSQE